MDKFSYITVKNEATEELTIQRSKFIGNVKRTDSKEEAEQFIKSIKKKHHDARHNAYAYVLKDGTTKCSDDGEPSSTAGVPILDIIMKSGYSDVCITVTRYFGGILLGTGGLVRAYSKTAKLALEKAGSVRTAMCELMEAVIPYSGIDKFNRFLSENGGKVEKTSFGREVTVDFFCEESSASELKNKIEDFSDGNYFLKTLNKEYKIID